MPVLEAEAPVAHNTHDKFHALVAKAQTHPPVKVAVAHPCDQVSLESVDEVRGGTTTSTSPERDYEKQWALTVMAHARRCLEHEMIRSRKLPLYRTISCTLDGSADVSYRKLALAAGITEGAVKVAVHRLRRRYREMIQREIANTVVDLGQVDEEMQFLLRAIEP